MWDWVRVAGGHSSVEKQFFTLFVLDCISLYLCVYVIAHAHSTQCSPQGVGPTGGTFMINYLV